MVTIVSVNLQLKIPGGLTERGRTKWFIISALLPLISYYSGKLHLMITEEMKVGFMTLEPIAKDGVS